MQDEPENPFNLEKLQKIIAAIARDPSLKQRFYEKSGFSEAECDEMMKAALESEDPQEAYEEVETL